MHWNDAESFLIDEAERDLRDGATARPCLLAYRGEERILIAFLREFDKGAYADPIIELLALAAPLGADRLAFSISGRAWSLQDPIPPVVAGGGDLRQPIVALHFADGNTDPLLRSSAHAYDLVAGDVRWGPVVRDEGGTVEGWIGDVLRFAVTTGRGQITGSDAEIRRQLNRCSSLGHLVGVGDGVARRLGLVAGR